MAARKWLVRSLYLALLAAFTGGGLILYTCLRPEFIHSELTQQIKDKFNNVDVEIQSAQLGLLGDITATNLRLIRHDDPTGMPFLLVPGATFHHDKQRLNDGKLVVRKIELNKPRLRIERDVNGRWNLADLLKPPKDNEPAPVMVLHDATIVVVDRSRGDTPIAEWTSVEATIVNDPLPVFAFQFSGAGAPSGPFAIDGHFDKRSGLSGSLDLPTMLVGNSLARAVESFNPDVAEYLKPLTGKASVHLELAWHAATSRATYHDLRVQLKDGRYQHASLPLPLEQIEVSLQSRNGNITLEQATARFGTGTVSVKMVLPKEPICAPGTVPPALPTVDRPAQEDRNLPGPTAWLVDFENRLRSLDVVVTSLPVTPEFIAKIPGRTQLINDMFKPSGPLGFTYAFRRDEGGWTKNLLLQPGGMEAVYRGFPYPLKNVRGTIRHSATESAPDNIKVDLLVDGAGTTASIKGTIKGTHPEADVDLTMEAKGVILDNGLIDALPGNNPALMRKMHASAMGDVVGSFRHNARTRREYGPGIFDNLFTIQVRRASFKYEAFPYPLENMTGTLVVRTVPERPTQLPGLLGAPMNPQEESDSTTLEFKGFQATHNGARFSGSGRKDPAPGGSILNLGIEADSLALDSDLRKALVAIRMEPSWMALDPSGRTNCAIRVKLFSKSDPEAVLNAAEDLEMSMGFNGGAVRPNFFAYQLNDVMGRVSYAKGRIDLRDFRAMHASSQLTLPYTEVLFRPGGGYWADVREARLNPLVIDGEFLQALPPGLRSSCEDLELSGPMSLHVTRMVVDEQPGPYLPRYLPGAARGVEPDEDENRQGSQYKPAAPVRPLLPTIYWDGCLTLQGASMKTGVPWDDIHGKFASWGLYKGDRMGAVRGNIAFDKATIAKQPAEAITAQLRVDPRQPDVLSIPAIKGKMYEGDLGGEAWVVFDSPTRYALQLNAARVHLSKIANHYKLPEKQRLEGLASAQIYLSNRFDERTGLPVLQGGGTIDVPRAKLLNLPVLLNLVKVVKLRVPDDTGFEEAHALFYIRGDRLKVGQLDLIGNAISLGGEGEMTLDGKNIQFEFYPVWTKLKEMFPLPRDWPGVVSKQFMKIKVTGDIDGKPLIYKAEPVPGIVDPVKRLVDRLK
jgi:hypothetical protein